MKRMTVRLRILNVSATEDKEEEIVHKMKEGSIDVKGICEARSKNEGQENIRENFMYVYKSNQEERYEIRFVLNPSFADRVK